MLAQLGPRMQSALREGDVLARLGGDEFAALLPNARAAQAAGDRIAEVLEQRFMIDGLALQVGASIGIALYPEHAQDGETLLRHSDVAMYQAKGNRSGTEFYARERDGNTRGRLQMLGELRDAARRPGSSSCTTSPSSISRPAASPASRRSCAGRTRRAASSPPADFIPLAEQAGLMAPLTKLVLDQALDQAARWRASGFDLTMAINVSATNLLDGRFTDAALAALTRVELRPESLVMEITEDVIMADPERSLEVVGRLSDAGVQVALDDFGTGYSSLAYLKHLPVDELKIDRSFVASMATDAADAAIVQTAIDLGRRLGIAVVAEGVEDAASLESLADDGREQRAGVPHRTPHAGRRAAAAAREQRRTPARHQACRRGRRPLAALPRSYSPTIAYRVGQGISARTVVPWPGGLETCTVSAERVDAVGEAPEPGATCRVGAADAVVGDDSTTRQSFSRVTVTVAVVAPAYLATLVRVSQTR